MNVRTRKYLTRCHLVCRAWVPRCRLLLFNEVSVNSQLQLMSLAKFLRESPFHAERVTILNINGEDPDPTWISALPNRLPSLPHLARLHLHAVDFTQQVSCVYQAYSRLRKQSTSRLSITSLQFSKKIQTIIASTTHSVRGTSMMHKNENIVSLRRKIGRKRREGEPFRMHHRRL